MKCFICDEAHKAIDCPQNPKRVMVAQEEEPCIDEAEAESRENLILRRTWIPGDKEILEVDWKRKNIFRMKCKCKDKVCKVIIDDISIDNLVST